MGALSLAADLGVGLPAQSALRMALLAERVGRALSLPAAARAELYYAALLRYLGCSGYAHEEATVTAGDDRALLPTLELCDTTNLVEVATAVVRKVGRGRPLATRAGAVARFLSDPQGYAKVARAHCDQAVALARGLDLPATVVTALGQVYERHDGRGAPHRLAGDQIVMPARVTMLAQVVEAFFRAGGAAAAIEIVRKRRGKQLDPTIADAFLADAAAIVAPLASPSVWDQFLDAEPEPWRPFSSAGLAQVAAAFAAYIDLKSPFTLGHSTGVARLAAAAATEARLPAPEAEALNVAALLHDLGRASVPNGIWDKPGPLDAAEREQVRLHAYHSERVLRQAPALAPFASLVANHHERLDGSGYHRGIGATSIDRASRLLAACDVYQALTEPRALREAATKGTLDREAVSAVLAAAGHARAPRAAAWPDGLSDREVEILRLVARGLSNKEIGLALHISPVTAKNHIAHIYEKTGIATRSAAALYAVTKALIEAG
jgi:HD-GYP domain-containing protein (c-di-GMP phosphodiesterase class II)/DNA-binding CsgD family transcriptional regulator